MILALLIPLFEADSMVNADGDPARHVVHGDAILQQGDVIRTDTFLLLQSGKPFLGFESGSQVLLALSHRIGGTVGLAALTTLVVVVMLSMLLAWLMRRGTDPLLALLTTVLTAMLTSIHWLARPHIFSWPLLLLLFFWLERERRPPLWWFAALFVLWVNLHGAFVLGWILIGLYFVGHLFESWWSTRPDLRAQEKQRAYGLVTALGISVFATVVNPYGWQLPWHVVEFFRDPWLRWLTQEFQSPNFLREDRLFLLSVAGTMLLLSLRPRPRWTHLIVIVATTGMALISTRNIVQFGLLAVPLLALTVSGWWTSAVARIGFIQRFAASARTGMTWPYVTAALLLLFGLAWSKGRVGGTQLLAQGFRPDKFPVAAVAWARANQVEGRLFNEFAWGGYLLYAWPETKVFIDGGSDHYGGQFLRAYGHVTTLQPGWRDSLDAWRIDTALLPRQGALTAELLLQNEWTPLYCDHTAALLQRGLAGVVDTAARSRCHAGGSE